MSTFQTYTAFQVLLVTTSQKRIISSIMFLNLYRIKIGLSCSLPLAKSRDFDLSIILGTHTQISFYGSILILVLNSWESGLRMNPPFCSHKEPPPPPTFLGIIELQDIFILKGNALNLVIFRWKANVYLSVQVKEHYQ